jgi:hypothetical protein
MNEDEFTGIFDSISPDDFATPFATAVDEASRSNGSFDEFVDGQIRAVRYAFAASSGKVDPLATLASPVIERVYAAYDDETLGQYIDRLAREASEMHATWLFIFKKTVVGTFETDDDHTVGVDDPESMQRALDGGTTQAAVYWYAEDRPGEMRRHGFLKISGNSLGDLVEGDARQTVNAFNRILEN